MSIPFKKDPVEFKQRSLFATNVFDLLPEDHECYVYNDIFEQLDTSLVEENFSELGQNAFHPRLITGILIYGYSQGVFSSRQIEKECHEDLGFMFISHCNCPNFRVLSDFRKEHHEFFKDCFTSSTVMSNSLAISSAEGTRSWACSKKAKVLLILLMEPILFNGKRTIRDCSANA